MLRFQLKSSTEYLAFYTLLLQEISNNNECKRGEGGRWWGLYVLHERPHLIEFVFEIIAKSGQQKKITSNAVAGARAGEMMTNTHPAPGLPREILLYNTKMRWGTSGACDDEI